jgi:hypothetical protein
MADIFSKKQILKNFVCQTCICFLTNTLVEGTTKQIPTNVIMQRKKLTVSQKLILEATGAPAHLAPLLETLMRDEIFHSTLDWQSVEQFANGARQAYDLYRSAPVYYDGLAILQSAEVRLTRLRQRLGKLSTPETARRADLRLRIELAEQSAHTAREALPRLNAFYAAS